MVKKTPISSETAQDTVAGIIKGLVYLRKSTWVDANENDMLMADHIIERAIEIEEAGVRQGILIHSNKNDLFHDGSIERWATNFLNRHDDGEKRLTALLTWRFMERIGISPWILQHSRDLVGKYFHLLPSP